MAHDEDKRLLTPEELHVAMADLQVRGLIEIRTRNDEELTEGMKLSATGTSRAFELFFSHDESDRLLMVLLLETIGQMEAERVQEGGR